MYGRTTTRSAALTHSHCVCASASDVACLSLISETDERRTKQNISIIMNSYLTRFNVSCLAMIVLMKKLVCCEWEAVVILYGDWGNSQMTHCCCC